MDSLFEPGYFDPLDSASSFLSFSSFADLANSVPSALHIPSSWDLPSISQDPSTCLPRSTPESDSEPTLSSPSDPFQVVSGAFEAPMPTAVIGIFNTLSKPGPSKLSLAVEQTADGHGPSTSSEWGTPVTPSLSSRSSDSVLAFVTPTDFLLPSGTVQGFSWDDAPATVSTSSYRPPTPMPLRVTSNPTLCGPKNLKVLKPVISLPALKKEEQMSAFQWFDGTELNHTSWSESKHLIVQFEDRNLIDKTLVGGFGCAFDTYDLGESVPAESTLFAAFQEAESSSTQNIARGNTTLTVEPATLDVSFHATCSSVSPMSWILTSAQDVDVPTLDLKDPMPAIISTAAYTVNPSAVLAPTIGDDRPSSAPTGFLSTPMGATNTMARTLTSDDFVYSQSAPSRDLFSYAPQQIPANPPAPTALYTAAPAVYPNGPAQFSRVAPLPVTPTPQRPPSRNLNVQINSPAFPTCTPAFAAAPVAQPITPQAVIFPSTAGGFSAAVPRTRAGTQPLQMTRKLSGTNNAYLPPTTPPTGAHLVRVHGRAIGHAEMPQMQGVRRQAVVRRVSSTDAPVMHSMTADAAQQPALMGRSCQSVAPNGGVAKPVLTRAPLLTVHPPPMTYGAGAYGPSPHRVHQPPYFGTMRSVARLPSPGRLGQRKASNVASSKPSRSGKRRATSSGGPFSWGETTFINFTSDDAEKLLTGVALSGSQSKRKREEAASKAAAGAAATATVVFCASSTDSLADTTKKRDVDDGSPRKRSKSA